MPAAPTSSTNGRRPSAARKRSALQPVQRVRCGNQQRLGPLPRGVRGRRPARGHEVPGPGELRGGDRATEGGAGGFGGGEMRALVLVVVLSIGPSFRLSAQAFPAKPPRPTPLSPVRFPPFK